MKSKILRCADCGIRLNKDTMWIDDIGTLCRKCGHFRRVVYTVRNEKAEARKRKRKPTSPPQP